MNVWATRVGGTVGAIAWLIGLPLLGAVSVIPSDAGYFMAGLVGAVLGCCVVTVTFAPAFRIAQARQPSTLPLVGVAVGLFLAGTSALEVLASEGALEAPAPGWIPQSADAAVAALFLWIVASSVVLRRALGNALTWLGILCGATLLASALESMPGFVHTNATIPLDFLLAAALWLSLPAWLVVFAWRTPSVGKNAVEMPEHTR